MKHTVTNAQLSAKHSEQILIGNLLGIKMSRTNTGQDWLYL